MIVSARVELVFDSTWEDVSEDVVSPVKAEWGLRGSGPKTRVADPGTMSFDLDNGATNSGGERGYYSPDHASVRTGFKLGTQVRLVLVHNTLGDKVVWVGKVSRVTTKAGVRDPVASVDCVDWLEEAALAKLAGIPVQFDQQSDALFRTLVAAVDAQPPGGVRAGAGSDVYPVALDTAQDERGRLISELQKVAMSEYGLVYVEAGVAVFEGRRRRGVGGTALYAFDEDEDIVGLPTTAHDRDQVANSWQVSVHPRRRDSSLVTLFSLGAAVEVKRGTSVTINCPYRDPDQKAQRVGGTDMQTPDAGEGDYQLTAAKDGTGSDLTGQLTVTATFGGNSASVTVANAGPADGFIPAGGLKLRGKGVYDFEPVLAEARDEASIAAYGSNPQTYDAPYQDAPGLADDLARYLVHLYKDPATRATSVTFLANWSNEVAEAAFTLGISDRISINAPSVGLTAAPYHINGCRLDVRLNGVVMVTWDLARADSTSYWLLEVPGSSELGETTVLGYGLFAAGWVLETLGMSELEETTFLN